MAPSRLISAAANYSASVYPLLTAGAAHLIESFGSEALKETYIHRMYAGQWQGTMALTEPQAGSSLSDLSTLAEPTDQGYYLLRGQKIFISASDHDGVDNIVNLLLARIKGAPPGVKGISLFVVPKFRPEADGSLAPNDIQVAGSFHKLGYRGSPICQLSLGENNDCRGYLVGEPHKGLIYMFQMMNEARIDVGMSAAAIASAAYYASLEYARERPQGRQLGVQGPHPAPDQHHRTRGRKADAPFSAGGGGGIFFAAAAVRLYADRARVLTGEEKEKYELLLDLLTPVAKTYPSEMGILSVSQGLQILGGYGYCDEFPLELYYRDIRIHPIHEGTTGIHGLDLLGRKVVMKGGRRPSSISRKSSKPSRPGKSPTGPLRSAPAGGPGKIERGYSPPGPDFPGKRTGILPGRRHPLPGIFRDHRCGLAVAGPGGGRSEGPGKRIIRRRKQFLPGKVSDLPVFLSLRASQDRGPGPAADGGRRVDGGDESGAI